MSLSGCQLHCRWRTKSIRHKFYECVYVLRKKKKTRKKKRKKKDDKIRDGRGALPNRPISTCHSQVFNQTWLSTYFLFLYLKKKKKKEEGMACPCGVLPFYSPTLWAEGLFHPRIISTHYNIPSHGSSLNHHNARPDQSHCSYHRPLNVFYFFRAGERVRTRVCNYVCACVC